MVRAYDPVAIPNLKKSHPEVTTVDRMYDALDGADALVLCTEWSEFRHPDFGQMGKRLKGKVVFDGRNIYRRITMQEMGFAYYSVGRPPVIAPHSKQI
jgi:UDPglucose 6-dehydrogenase